MSPILRLMRVAFSASAGGLTIVLLAGIRYGEPPWMQSRELIIVSLGLAAAFISGLAIVYSPLLRQEKLTGQFVRTICIASLVCFPVIVLARLADIDLREVQKLTLLIELGLVYFLLLLYGTGLPYWFALAVNLVALAIGAKPLFSEPARASFGNWLESGVLTSVHNSTSQQFVFSPLHDLSIYNTQVIPAGMSRGLTFTGGAIERIGNSTLLLIDSLGRFYKLVILDDGVSTTHLPNLRAEINRGAYDAESRQPSNHFRVTDMVLTEIPGGTRKRVIVAHHQWDSGKKCVTHNIDEAVIDMAQLDVTVEWTTRFESSPCMPDDVELSNETGGRLAWLAPSTLLFTLGVPIGKPRDWYAQPDNQYGKILEIDTANWTHSVFSTGHRNPQGLLVDEGTVWSTEHGPDGGDELNIVFAGEDYGWPSSSLGVNYGKKTLGGSDAPPGRHTTGERPVFAWLPSIGVSRLIRLQGAGFSSWRGDLLVGSLSGRGNGYSLYRVRMVGDRVQYVEKIYVGVRVRDLIEMDSGQVVTWDGSDVVQVISPAEHIFSECSGCHVAVKGFTANGIGPDLYGIVGAYVASVEGFEYSRALRNLGGRWSSERLDWFLQDPKKAVPGTSMAHTGIADENKRRAIIEYLNDLGTR